MKDHMAKRRKQQSPVEIVTRVDDETYEELLQITGQKILHYILWEESLVDALIEANSAIQNETRADLTISEVFDIDLYLEGGVYFELYETSCFPQLDETALDDKERLDSQLRALINQGTWLDEIAVDEIDQLVFVCCQNHQPVLYILINGWVLDAWDELPTE